MQANATRKADSERALTSKQERALLALLSNPTTKEAAAAVSVNETTLWRWMKHKDFQAAYIARRREAVSLAIARLQQTTDAAVGVLRDIMQNTTLPTTARVTAARTVIEYALRGSELEDLTERVAALERSRGFHE